ncbi:MAG: hypothetical protein RIC82_06320, partial [Parvibaculum sp.]
MIWFIARVSLAVGGFGATLIRMPHFNPNDRFPENCTRSAGLEPENSLATASRCSFDQLHIALTADFP